jgi:hypothetical protein
MGASAFQEYGNSFEDVLVADESGRVLWQLSESGPRIADLRPILGEGTDIVAKQRMFGFLNSTPQEPVTTRPSDSKPLDSSGNGNRSGPSPATGVSPLRTAEAVRLERLSQGSSATKVAIAGKDYLLFAQTSPVVLGNAADKASQWNLVLVGLRLATRIDAESHAIPYSVLIWLALCAAVLLGFSWPWFKLQYMSNTERFRPRDGWLLLFTLLLVTAGVTLILLNASYVQRSTARADAAMRSLADQMKENFEQEISRALCQLEEIQGTKEFRTVLKEQTGFRWLGSYPIENDAGRSYP